MVNYIYFELNFDRPRYFLPKTSGYIAYSFTSAPAWTIFKRFRNDQLRQLNPTLYHTSEQLISAIWLKRHFVQSHHWIAHLCQLILSAQRHSNTEQPISANIAATRLNIAGPSNLPYRYRAIQLRMQTATINALRPQMTWEATSKHALGL